MKRRSGLFLRAWLVCSLLMFVTAGSAQAAATVTFTNTQLSYVSAVGDNNQLRVTQPDPANPTVIRFQDVVNITSSVSSCTGSGTMTLTCTISGVSRIVTNTSDGTDTIRFGNSTCGDDFTLPVSLFASTALPGMDDFAGTPNNDGMNASGGNDVLLGCAGNDILTGNDGDDTINGGAGNDNLNDGRGTDTLFGEGGNDELSSLLAVPDSPDLYNGGEGFDTLSYNVRTAPVIVTLDNVANDGAVGEGDNALDNMERVVGGTNDDEITGNSSINQLEGRDGNDILNGLDGIDTIQGGNGNDIIDGGGGDDLIQGQNGDDTIRGGAGGNNIDAGSGQDTVFPGAGVNFVMVRDGEADIVMCESNRGTTVISDEQDTVTGCGPIPLVSVDDVEVDEGDSGTANNATFTVSLSQQSQDTVVVNYSTGDGTAENGEDYVTTNGTLTFAPGETSKTVDVPIVGDTDDEEDEFFRLNLSGEINATLADEQGRGTILDDDEAPAGASISSGPSDGSTTDDNTPTFEFSSDEEGATFECRVDSEEFEECSSPFTTDELSDGKHTFEVRGVNSQGVPDETPDSRTFIVDTTPPDEDDNDNNGDADTSEQESNPGGGNGKSSNKNKKRDRDNNNDDNDQEPVVAPFDYVGFVNARNDCGVFRQNFGGSPAKLEACRQATLRVLRDGQTVTQVCESFSKPRRRGYRRSDNGACQQAILLARAALQKQLVAPVVP